MTDHPFDDGNVRITRAGSDYYVVCSCRTCGETDESRVDSKRKADGIKIVWQREHAHDA